MDIEMINKLQRVLQSDLWLQGIEDAYGETGKGKNDL